MPRDGSGVYTQPFPEVIEGTTIESVKYNGNVNDVEQDLNTPRPIVAGGTGANNAADAMNNLGGEGSKIQVTNYDSHNFTAGSFYSLASATAPPVAGHAFAGICYPAVVAGVATSDMFVEVRDRDEPNQPGSQYVRQKKAGVWSGWQKAEGTAMGGTPPAAPANGMFWWDPTRGKLFVFYSDPNTSQWVEAVATPDMNPDDFVRIDVPQNLTEAQKIQARDNIDAAPIDALAYNGMQVNGSMEISQENGSTGITVSNTTKYIVDGWLVSSLGVQVVTGVQVAGGYSKALQVWVGTVNSVPAAGDAVYISTRIEGYRVARLQWGTAGASPITIAFWVYAARAGAYSGAVANAAFNRSYPFPFTVNAPHTWEYKTVSIPGDTTGTWAKDDTSGMSVIFTMMAGSTYLGTAYTWTASGKLGVTGMINTGVAATTDQFQITGIVVLPGIEAPSEPRWPLIMRPYDQELVTCQRYWSKSQARLQSYCLAGQNFMMTVPFPVQMRATPTMDISGVSSVNLSFGPGITTPADNTVITIYATALAAGTANWACTWTATARL